MCSSTVLEKHWLKGPEEELNIQWLRTRVAVQGQVKGIQTGWWVQSLQRILFCILFMTEFLTHEWSEELWDRASHEMSFRCETCATASKSSDQEAAMWPLKMPAVTYFLSLIHYQNHFGLDKICSRRKKQNVSHALPLLWLCLCGMLFVRPSSTDLHISKSSAFQFQTIWHQREISQHCPSRGGTRGGSWSWQLPNFCNHNSHFHLLPKPGEPELFRWVGTSMC